MPEPKHDLLYHYTSQAGFQGIVASDRIWATDIHFLNDWTEFQHLFSKASVETLVKAFVEGLPKDLHADARRVVIDGVLAERNFQKLLTIIEARPPIGEPKEAFVCSFSADGTGDRLSQWRGYSHSSQGFSLGFDKALLRKHLESQNTPDTPVELVECIYDDVQTLQRLTEIGRFASGKFLEIRSLGQAVPPWFRTERTNAPDDYKRTCYNLLKSLSVATTQFFRAATQFKHPGFHEELEWRVVYSAFQRTLLPKTVKFRDGQFGQTPYIEIPLGLHKPDTCSLRRIVVVWSLRGYGIFHC